MTIFSCDKCDRIFKAKQNLDGHIKKNACKIKGPDSLKCNICDKIFAEKKGLVYHTSKGVCGKIKKYKCENCCKMFSHSSSLWNHNKKCIKPDPDKIVQDKVQRLEDEVKTMKLAMEAMIVNNTINNNNNKTKINNNSHNNTINVNNNNNNNIVLVKFGDEDFSKLTQTDLYHALNKGFYAANALVEKMHFDPNTPENHNVCFSNLRDKYGSIYNGTEWVIQNKEDIIDKLIDDKRLLIECSKDTKAFKKLEALKQEAVLRMLDFDVDNEHIVLTKKDLMIMMYNKRKYPMIAIKNSNQQIV